MAALFSRDSDQGRACRHDAGSMVIDNAVFRISIASTTSVYKSDSAENRLMATMLLESGRIFQEQRTHLSGTI